jgi:transposase
MGEKRRNFTRAFKLDAVKMVVDGKQSVTEVAASLGIRADMLRDWKRQVEAQPRAKAKELFRGHGKALDQEAELTRLRRENETLQQERDFLKKAAAYFAQKQS